MTDSVPSKTVTFTANFKLVFLSVLGITIFSMLTTLFLLAYSASLAVDASSDKAAFNGAAQAFMTAWKLGFGAMVGLLGGKAI